MADLGGGTVARGLLDVYPEPRPRPRLTLRLERMQRLIGAGPERGEAVRILQALGFAVDDSGPALEVVVPSFRRDIVQEDDLVEEVARIWGYDKIPLRLSAGGQLLPVRRPATLRLARAATRQLVAVGLSEVMTYAFVDPARLRLLGWADPTQLIQLQNPLSVERSVLRPSLVPGLLEVLVTNISRQTPDVRVFETGQVFSPRRAEDVDRPVHEELWLGVALTGLRQPRAWHAARDRVDIHDAKGAVELVLAAGEAPPWTVEPWGPAEAPRYLEQGRAGRVMVDGRMVACFGEVARHVREALDLPAPVFLAEVSLVALSALPRTTPRYEPLPRFPAVQRDLALVVGAEVTAGEIEAHIRAMRLPLLARLMLFDVYTGGQIGPGRRSLAWSLTFQAPDRTLTDREVNELHARIVEELSNRFDAEVRGS
jgi:phenylalanyl-tRNA synthetase beta chain